VHYLLNHLLKIFYEVSVTVAEIASQFILVDIIFNLTNQEEQTVLANLAINFPG
jgi:hypothetical protein